MRLTSAIVCGCLALAWAVAVPADTPTTPEAGAPTEAAAEAPDVSVALELSQEFFYEGDSLNLQISVRNGLAAQTENPIKTSLHEGLVVRRAGAEPLKATGKPSRAEPVRPASLSPLSFYGAMVELTELYPELRRRGTFDVYWSADGVVSDLIRLTVIPRFDPAKSYMARLETAHGPIAIEFYADRSPLSVKSFVDMAHAGLYDGLSFHEVHADSHVLGGDPRSATPPRRPYFFPAESSSLPLVAGTVIFKPVGAAPPTNGPEFIILLKPQPAWTGQVTVLGQVVSGLETVQKISRVPSSMQGSRPFFKPVEEVKIQRVVIEEKPATAPAS